VSNVHGATLFETPIGRCGIAWGARGIVGVQLPEPAGSERGRLLQRFPDACETRPPADVEAAIGRIVALLEGQAPDLDSIGLDMSAVPEFDRRVYEITRAIPRGTTRSYGEIAADLGDPGAARAVGQALGRNPFPIIVPCHRVLAAAGRPGGFSAHGGVATKLRLLAIEGAPGNVEFDF
jgi:methylated-DNA-[protein]-cysteine S-methyltransferase